MLKKHVAYQSTDSMMTHTQQLLKTALGQANVSQHQHILACTYTV